MHEITVLNCMMQNLTELKKKKSAIRLRDLHTPDRRGRQKISMDRVYDIHV